MADQPSFLLLFFPSFWTLRLSLLVEWMGEWRSSNAKLNKHRKINKEGWKEPYFCSMGKMRDVNPRDIGPVLPFVGTFCISQLQGKRLHVLCTTGAIVCVWIWEISTTRRFILFVECTAQLQELTWTSLPPSSIDSPNKVWKVLMEYGPFLSLLSWQRNKPNSVLSCPVLSALSCPHWSWTYLHLLLWRQWWKARCRWAENFDFVRCSSLLLFLFFLVFLFHCVCVCVCLRLYVCLRLRLRVICIEG